MNNSTINETSASIENTMKRINAQLYNLNLIKIYEGPISCKILLKNINEIILESSIMSSEESKINFFIELNTWFQFKELLGEKLLEYYVKCTGNPEINKGNTEKFIEAVSKEIMYQHRKEDIGLFIKRDLPLLIDTLKNNRLILKSSKDVQVIQGSNKDLENCQNMLQKMLKKHTFFATEDDTLARTRACVLLGYLCGYDPEKEQQIHESVKYILEADSQQIQSLINVLL